MKILFTDLDETLLNEHGQVSEYTKQFLDSFTAAGNKLVLSSGRALDSILDVKNKAGLHYPGMYISAFNGCLLYDVDNQKAIKELRLSMEYVDYLQAAAKAHDLHIQTYTDSHILIPQIDEEIQYYCIRNPLPYQCSEKFTKDLDKEPFKMLAIHLHDKSILDQFSETLADWTKNRVQTIYSSDKYLEFFHIDGGKGNGVRTLCDLLDIPLSDSFAAGDADNDISMIESAGCGIAMKNAAPTVKAVADVITEYDNTQDGLAKMLEKLL